MRIPKLAVWLLLIGLSGCGSVAQKPEKISEQEKAVAGLSIEEIASKSEGSLKIARDQEWGLFAPRKLDELEKAVGRVRDAAERGNRKRLVEESAYSEKVTAEGQAVVTLVKTELADELKMRTRLRELKAENAYPQEYEQVATQLRELIVRTGEGKLVEKESKQRLALNTKMSALEIKVVRFNALNEIELALADAKKKGAEKLAPLTLTEALASFKEADAFIAQSPRDAAGVAARAQQAAFSTRHLVQVMESVQSRTQQKSTAEQVIRDEEMRLMEIGRALGQPDLRDRRVPEQINALVGAIDQRLAAAKTPAGEPKAAAPADAELATARAEIEKLHGQLAALEVMKFQNLELKAQQEELMREVASLRKNGAGGGSVAQDGGQAR